LRRNDFSILASRTPYKIPLGGGGTDLPSHYSKYGGFLISASINKYVYVMLNERFEGDIRVSHHLAMEVKNKVHAIEHPVSGTTNGRIYTLPIWWRSTIPWWATGALIKLEFYYPACILQGFDVSFLDVYAQLVGPCFNGVHRYSGDEARVVQIQARRVGAQNDHPFVIARNRR
jgi:hypothetical protein